MKAEAPTVREAIDKFLVDCDARHLGWEAKYRHLLEDGLLSWCDSKGLSNVRHLTVDALRQFRQSWKDSPLYATKNLERLRTFLRFCQQAGWIKQNPATEHRSRLPTALVWFDVCGAARADRARSVRSAAPSASCIGLI